MLGLGLMVQIDQEPLFAMMSANQDLVLANGEASPVINVEFVPPGEPNEDTEPNSMDYEMNDEHTVNPPPWFPTAAQVGTGVSISWYNAWLKAWLSWHHRVSDHKRLQISYTRRLMLPSASQTINNHNHDQARKEIDQYRVKKPYKPFPAPTRFRSSKVHGITSPLVSATKSQSSATSATSSSDRERILFPTCPWYPAP
ncbi:hypothetical protein CEK25_009447 [Fusarium fujikuroi]|nr:hypothetical protein CEK25_009447 [Fusarium fujikuroi]